MKDLKLTDLVDKEMIDHFKKNTKSYDTQRSKPTEEALEEALEQTIKEYNNQYKAQWNKHINEREFYKDKLGADVIFVVTPNEKPRFAKTGNPYYYADCPLMKSDVQVYFKDEKDLNPETAYVLRGKISKIQYRDTGSQENTIELKAYLKQKGVDNLEDIDLSDYERKFIFNLYNIIVRGA